LDALGAWERHDVVTLMKRPGDRQLGGAYALPGCEFLDSLDELQVVVSVHAASIEDVLDLLCRAYTLSVRERELVGLIVQGLDTGATAERLSISPYTVQDHLKSIFRKVGANSRLELLTGLLAQVK
jgi:DNA-binding CsgD family transcriptional regulator